MCNFRDAITIKHLDETHIQYIENFKRNRLPKIVINWKTSNNSSMIKDEDFFGPVYCFDPTLFEFTPGDRFQMAEIATYVKECTLKTPNYFKNAALTTNQIEENVPVSISSSSIISNEIQSIIPTRTHYFLNMLMLAANQNASRKKEGYRYDSRIKKYASYLRMIAGPLAYETIQKNLPCSLPALTSTNRYIQKSNCQVIEGVLRCKELLQFLNERNLEKVVVISEDATRIVGQVQYNGKTNEITGFVLPINRKNGMPKPFSFPARNVDEIMQYFDHDQSISPLVNVVMAQPVGNSPPFCLLLYGTDNKYTNDDVCKRWTYIKHELRKLGIYAIAFSSDSDPRYNTAMRKLSNLGKISKWFGESWFSLGERSHNEPADFSL